MAKEPQTPLDDELARHEQESEAPEQEAEERLRAIPSIPPTIIRKLKCWQRR